MSITILKGNIVSTPSFGKLDIIENGYLVAENGIIQGAFQNLPEKYSCCPVEDYSDDLILQSFADLHLHAPQYPMLGIGMDLPLLDWLNTYTFPTESKFSDSDYAREVYRELAKELAENGTTRVCMFSSLHREATLILMEELENAGITGYVGKVNMDRNSGSLLRETTNESIEETLRWLEECKHFKYIKPIITPRFTPSCSNELLEALGKIAKAHHLPIQSHLSENTREISWVQDLHPDCTHYWQTYKKYNLWNDKTLMAHCVWSDTEEQISIKEAGVTAVHCADSNQNLISGVAPVKKMLSNGIKVALGSDIAGGDHLCMFDVIASTIRASKARRILDNWNTDFLSVPEALFLGTSAGAEFFGEQPGFAPGNPLHAILLQDNKLISSPEISIRERVERSIYRRQPDAIKAVWSAGRKIYSRD